MFAGQRLAYRIARREAWRYKGRSALSITLLGLPLLAVAVGASAYDTAQLSEEETAAQVLGENEAYVEFGVPGAPLVQHSWHDRWILYDQEDYEDPGRAVTDTEILSLLPIGSWIAPYSPDSGSGDTVQVETPDGLGQLFTHGYDLADDLYEAAGLEYLEGSAPGRGEVVVSAAAADYLELGVGDDLVVESGAGSGEHEISGIVEMPWDLNGRYAIGDAFPNQASGWLVDTPEPVTKDQALALNELGMTVWAQSLLDEPVTGPYSESSAMMDDAELLIYGLIVVVVVMEVVLLAGPAFAISARRRTREFALMSANGATPGQVRSVVLAGGVLFGLLAAVAAIVLGVGLVAAGTPWLEQFVGHRSAGLRVMPALQALLVGVALATGLLSALAAAISASRINVVEALTGRAGRRKGSKRWMFAGIAMVAAGVVAGLGGVAIWSLPLMAAAIVLAQLGMVVCTPALLSFASRLGRWLPLAPRMALREAGRNRGSAAPAIAAVLGVVAGGMAFSMIVTADTVRQEQEQEQILTQGQMSLTLYNNADGTVMPAWDAALAEAEATLEANLGDVSLTPVTKYSPGEDCAGELENDLMWADCAWTVLRPDANECSYWDADRPDEAAERAAVEAAREDPRCDESLAGQGAQLYDVPGSTDPEVVAEYTELEGEELARAVEVLEAGGVLVSDPWALTEDDTVVLRKSTTIFDEEGYAIEPPPADVEVELPAMAVERGQLGFSELLLSPAAAAALDMQESQWQRSYLVEAAKELEPGTAEALAEDFNRELAGGDVWASFAVTDYTDPFMFYFTIAVTGLCALVALGATAVSTGLIIAEQRRDMATLGAVGAAPGLRKRFAMWQTVVIAAFGAGLGTLAGVVGYALIREALNRPFQWSYPFQTLYGWELPWASFAIMLLAVPLVAAAGALVFTKATLPSERRIT
ncbi:ABC transporter permease [Glycomyces terrestris]|uniref:ABC transporter permease n=1 Tax=Glycomyces terrestris TaxID=2493553 RepID=A0A426V587_9ACTN|nr:ABC transporter permease [Glycomyces terrestris]RRS02064.1 ABC transporter permease [Glycomyces terrestris]